jgi:hypothetical protein
MAARRAVSTSQAALNSVVARERRDVITAQAMRIAEPIAANKSKKRCNCLRSAFAHREGVIHAKIIRRRAVHRDPEIRNIRFGENSNAQRRAHLG